MRLFETIKFCLKDFGETFLAYAITGLLFLQKITLYDRGLCIPDSVNLFVNKPFSGKFYSFCYWT